jgi:amino acid transporter
MPESSATGLRGKLNTPQIALLVIAAAAPLAAIVGTVPLAFTLGNGAGLPGMYVFAGLILLCFSVGYAAMSSRIVNAGGFYTYLSRGVGRPAAVAGGFVAVVAYNAVSIGLLGAFGYFAQLTAAQNGLNLHWAVWSGVALVLVALLGYRQIEMSARLLAVLMVAEIGVLTILDLAVIARLGLHALPATSLAPSTVFSGATGIAMMFTLMSFIGFESAALYGEETVNPKRSVPLATYASVVLISVFYAITSWAAVGAVGKDRLQQVAGQQLGNLFFVLSTQYVSPTLTTIMQVFLCTSLLAAALALHNATNRYTFVLGRDRVLPRLLGQAHRQYHSPHRASVVQSVLCVIVIGAFAIAGFDPYTNLATSTLGIGTLGIVGLQASAAVSVPGFFRHRCDGHWWRTGVAPLISAVGLAGASVLLVINFPVLTGTDNMLVNALPWLLAAATVVGVIYALWLRARHPERYAGIARVEVRPDVSPTSTDRPPSTVGMR